MTAQPTVDDGTTARAEQGQADSNHGSSVSQLKTRSIAMTAVPGVNPVPDMVMRVILNWWRRVDDAQT
jgi:hypothetical protein